VSSWLIPSFGLPVAMTTGRLVVLTFSEASGHPITAVIGSAFLPMVAYGALAARRRRRASQRGSIS
jgi:MYXO-CTERM domain-containing protein